MSGYSQVRAELLTAYPTKAGAIDRYVRFLMAAPIPTTGRQVHGHHMLSRAKFPQFADFRFNPWNQRLMFIKDHRFAHALLKDVHKVHRLLSAVRPSRKPKMIRFLVHLDPSQIERLKSAADEMKTSAAWALRHAIDIYLAKSKR